MAQIARKHRSAVKLFRTGVYPQATYGHQATGISPSQLRGLRTEATRATGRMKPGRCATALIQVIHGAIGWGPAVRLKQEVLSTFISFWQVRKDLHSAVGRV